MRKIHKKSKPVRRCCSESEDYVINCPNSNCQSNKKDHGNGEIENGGDENGGDENGGDENGGFVLNRMEEIGRTRLEINDVCYINGKYLDNLSGYSCV